MKEKEKLFIVNGKEYKVVFNLNVMQEIQNEYGSFTRWGELTDGFCYKNGERVPKLDEDGNIITKKIKNSKGVEEEIVVYETKEVDLKALIFGIKSMLNEAIDIDNENKEQKQAFLTDKQVGRLVTEMGLNEATNQLNQTVIDSTTGDEPPKNE